MDFEPARRCGQPFTLPVDVAQLWVDLAASGLSAEAFETDPRHWQFEAGRWACAQLLRSLGAPDVRVGRAASLEPVWPAGYAGSITHKHSLVAVAVGPADACKAIGVDIEKIVCMSRVEEIEEICLHPLERASPLRGGLGACFHASLCFSAKESIYKALYPKAKRFIDYLEAVIEDIDLQRGTWRAKMLTDVCDGVGRGQVLTGSFRWDLGSVYTSLVLR
jgi:enterobactin synthetase component D